MSRSLQLVVLAVAAAVALGVGFAVSRALHSNPDAQGAANAGVPASFAPFTMTDVNGDSRSSSEWKERTLLINFWATWCPPCIEELPSMNRAWSKLEPEGIGMLAINAGEDRFDVESFLGRVPIDFTAVLGGLDTLPNWSVRALPTTIVIDQTGKVVLEALGPREWDDAELLQQVIDLL